MSYINDYRMHIEAAKEIVNKHSTEMVKSFFEDLFKQYAELDMIYIYGYTPSFNDGDPCYHRQYAVIDDGEIQDYVEEYLDELEDDEELEINSNLTSTQRREISNDLLVIDDLLEEIYGTDWYLLINRDNDGTISISDGEYSCGY